MRKKTEFLGTQFSSLKAESVCDVLAVDGGEDCLRRGVVTADWAIKGGVVGVEVEEAAGRRRDCITMEEPGGLHVIRFPPDTILLSVKEECHGGSSHA